MLARAWHCHSLQLLQGAKFTLLRPPCLPPQNLFCWLVAGIPDGTKQLATQFGLVPYSDALEEIDVSQLPGVGAAFGVDSLTVPRADSVDGHSESGKEAGDSGSEEGARLRGAGGATPAPPELVEATIKRGGSASAALQYCSACAAGRAKDAYDEQVRELHREGIC